MNLILILGGKGHLPLKGFGQILTEYWVISDVNEDDMSPTPIRSPNITVFLWNIQFWRCTS